MGIIAAFAGTGKTTFCKEHENAIDFVCMPFKYLNINEISDFIDDGERIKAHPDLILCENWQKYYYDALMETYMTYPDQIIVIPTVGAVLEWLQRDSIPYTLVYPCTSAKQEYERRFKERGNTEDFLSVFVDRWDFWMEEVRSHEGTKKMELNENEYLSDVIQMVSCNSEKTIKDKTAYIRKLQEKAREKMLQEEDFFKQEKINGKVFYLPKSEGVLHSLIVGNIFYLLRKQIEQKKNGDITVIAGNMPLTVGDECYVFPDIMLFADKESISEESCQGVPGFVAEVVSPLTESRDTCIKKELYEKLGVREYWLVIPKECCVEIYYLEDGQYVLKSRAGIYDAKNVFQDNARMEHSLKEYPEIRMDLRWIFFIDI